MEKRIIAFERNGNIEAVVCKTYRSAMRLAKKKKLPYRLYDIKGRFLEEG